MQQERQNEVVIARLRSGPILVWITIALSVDAYFFWELVWGDGENGALWHHLLGPLTLPLGIGASLLATLSFCQMWRERHSYLRHDEERLYQGAFRSWPLSSISGVIVTSNFLGIHSLRIGFGSSGTSELAKCYFLVESPGDVRAILEQVISAARSLDR